MASEDSKDLLNNVDWKTVGGAVTTESSQPVIKKRLPKKIRQIPECYFLPRRSLPSALAFCGVVCAAGVGAGMLLEVWINKKIKGEWQQKPCLLQLARCQDPLVDAFHIASIVLCAFFFLEGVEYGPLHSHSWKVNIHW